MRMDKFTTPLSRRCRRAVARRRPRPPVHRAGARDVRAARPAGRHRARLLTKAGANVNVLRSQLGEALDRLPKVEGTPGEVHVSNELGKLLNVTDKLAQQRGDQFISSELFVLAALEDRATLGRLLEKAGAVKGAIEKRDRRGARRREGRGRQRRGERQALRNTRSTSPRAPSRASSIPSSAATTRSAAPSRCCSAAPRTIRC